MAFEYPPPAPRDPEHSGFDLMAGGFSDEKGDAAASPERGPVPADQFLRSTPAPPSPKPPHSTRNAPPGSRAPNVPSDTDLSLRNLTAALTNFPAPSGSSSRKEPLSLSDLAEELNQKLNGAPAAPAETGDLLSGSREPAAAAEEDTPPSGLKILEEFLQIRTPPVAAPAPGGLPNTSPPSGLPAKPGPAASSTPARPPVSPAAIRAASGSRPSPPQRRQGDVFLHSHFQESAPPEPPPPSAPAPESPARLPHFSSPGGQPPAEFSSQAGTLAELAASLVPKLPEGPPASVPLPAPSRPHAGINRPAPPASAPVPAAGPPPMADAGPAPVDDSAGLGLAVGGTLLILLGIATACHLPLLWLDHETASPWTRQKIEAGLFLETVASLLLLTVGIGSLLLRRWAPPLIMALGWLAVFAAAFLMGVTGFLLGTDQESFQLTRQETGLLVAALLVPLIFLIFYEKRQVAATCAASHPAESWTDRVPVPGLMVLCCGLATAAASAAMLRHQPAFPLPTGVILTGPPAQAAWTGLAAVGLLIAFCAAVRRSAAWWLLLLVSLVLASTLGACGLARHPEWSDFLTALGHPGPMPASPAPPLLAGLAAVPLFLVLALSRRAFFAASPPS